MTVGSSSTKPPTCSTRLPGDRRAAPQTCAPVARREAYAADITYGTNNEFGFDYLRDNMVVELAPARRSASRNFAIVDEVDNILIDEARTPLIICGRPRNRADKYMPVRRSSSRELEGGRGLHVDEKPQGRSPDDGASTRSSSRLGDRQHYDADYLAWPATSSRRSRPSTSISATSDYVVKDGEVDHRRRVHRPPDAGPALVAMACTRRSRPRRASRSSRRAHARHDHVPELLPHVQQARRHDRHGRDRGGGVCEDLQARRGVIPTNRPMVRDDYADLVYQTEGQVPGGRSRRSWRCTRGRPVLVGTISVEKSERLGEMLKRRASSTTC